MIAKTTLIIAILFCSLANTAYLKPLRELSLFAKRIEKTGHSHTKQEQIRLLAKLKHTPIPSDKRVLQPLESILSALAFRETFPHYNEKVDLIIESLQTFHKIEGFSTTFKRALASMQDARSFKGYMYELEKALEITKQMHPEKIIAFNGVLEIGKYKREFDILTTWRTLECKNISWKSKQNKDALRTQFLHQQTLVELLNLERKKQRIYQICSKQPIPKTWKEWFEQHNISVA